MRYQRIIRNDESYMSLKRSEGSIELFQSYVYYIFEYNKKYKNWDPIKFIDRFGKIENISINDIKRFKYSFDFICETQERLNKSK